MEENKANTWGSAIDETTPKVVLPQTQVVNTKKKELSKYYIVILLLSVFLLLGLVFYLYTSQNTPNNTTNQTSISSSVNSTDETLTSESTLSSSNSSKENYFTYKTNVGRFVVFDYPDGGKITITSNRDDKTFTKATDIQTISIEKDNLTLGMSAEPEGADECTIFTYDNSKPNVVSYKGPEYTAMGVKITDVKSGNWDISKDRNVVVNSTKGYALIASSSIPAGYSKFLMLDNYNVSTGLRGTDGVYKNICNNLAIRPAGLIGGDTLPLFNTAFCGVSGGVESITEANKCVELLDRFLTSFRVK